MRANSPSYLSLTRAALLAFALYFPSLPHAQEVDIQDAIDSAAEALILLDVKASDCISALDSGADPQAHCDDFIEAVDGEVLASYINQCRLLKNWRDDYVELTVATDLRSDGEENTEMLRRLVAIEYTCGENTLQARTEFVVAAFNRTRNNTGGSASVERQLSQGRFNALDDAERRRLRDAVQNQQRRSLRENERQFDALENELIRQQLPNTNPVN